MNHINRLLFHATLFLVTATTVVAQDLPWQPLVRVYREIPNINHYVVKDIGYTLTVVPDPADPKGESWYTFTPGYLWHTHDMGVTLREVPGTGRTNHMISGLAVAHGDPDILYIITGINVLDIAHSQSVESVRFEGDGVYRSADRGETWTRLPFFPGVDVQRDLYVPTSIATSAYGDTVMVSTRKRILRSIDHGQTWEAVHPELPIIRAKPSFFYPSRVLPEHAIERTTLYHHPWSMRHVFVTVDATDNRGHLYVFVTHDGGDHWDYLKVDDHPPTYTQNMEDDNVWSFAADPRNPNIFWAQVARSRYAEPSKDGHRKIFRSADGGQTWVEVPIIRHEKVESTGGYWADTTHPANSMHVHPMSSDTLLLGWSFNAYKDGKLISRGRQGGRQFHFLQAYPEAYRGYRAVTANPRYDQKTQELTSLWDMVWIVNDLGAGRRFSTGILPANIYVSDVCTTPTSPWMDPSFRYVARVGHPRHGGWRYQQGHGKVTPQMSTLDAHQDPPIPGQSQTRSSHLSGWTASSHRLECNPSRYGYMEVISYDRHARHKRNHLDSSFTKGIFIDSPVSASFSRANPDRIWVLNEFAIIYRADVGETEVSTTRIESHPREEQDGIFAQSTGIIHAHDADADVIYTEGSVSLDGGVSWRFPVVDKEIQLRYTDRVFSHPTNPAVIYSCNRDGLREWGSYLRLSRMRATASEYGACRDLMIFPNDPERMWMGTDTGLWETWDRGRSWTLQNRGLPKHLPILAVHLSHDYKEILVSVFARGLFGVPVREVDAMLVSNAPADGPPESTEMLSNYPNPFISETTLQFSMTQDSHVRMEIYDILGRRVSTATDQFYSSGSHQLRWDGSGLPSGIYFVRMERDGHVDGVHKVVRQ